MISYNCPTCKDKVKYTKENSFRPFCSKRCQLIDLGEWASEGHAIAGKSAKEELLSEQLEELIKKGDY